jgi:hypothetical protein
MRSGVRSPSAPSIVANEAGATAVVAPASFESLDCHACLVNYLLRLLSSSFSLQATITSVDDNHKAGGRACVYVVHIRQIGINVYLVRKGWNKKESRSKVYHRPLWRHRKEAVVYLKTKINFQMHLDDLRRRCEAHAATRGRRRVMVNEVDGRATLLLS